MRTRSRRRIGNRVPELGLMAAGHRCAGRVGAHGRFRLDPRSVFAAAFATHNSRNAFLIGLAASLGAGIWMGFAEALADDGKISLGAEPLFARAHLWVDDRGQRDWPHHPLLIPDFCTAANHRRDRGRLRLCSPAPSFNGATWRRRPYPPPRKSCLAAV